MHRRFPHSRWLVAALAVGLFLAGCPTEGDDDDDDDSVAPEPVVAVSGDHGVEVDATVALSASTADGTDAGYTWSSASASIATVDADGVVTGVAAGETTITATGTDTGAAGEHAIVVFELGAGEAVVLVSGEFALMIGDSTTLSAETVNGEDASYGWASSDETVATVDADGMVTGVAAGEVTITATGADTGAAGDFGMVVAEEPFEAPYEDEWAGSGHADATAEAFVHWDEDDPPEVPTSCAKCHSTPGYLDFLGEDGTAFGSVENAAPIGTVIECQACHNASAQALDMVTFPSGVEIHGLGSEARCMTCHQGRESTDDVDQVIVDSGVADDDTVDEDISFQNIHYFAAGATLYGGLVRGGYQYADQMYDARFRHVGSNDTCFECHDPHSLEVQVGECSTCHTGVTDVDDVQDVRMMASLTVDYDGDGNLSEGLYGEIDTLVGLLYDALTAYASENAGADAICYDSHAYPYFFIDTNADGACDASEASYGNRYVTWTARLLRGAYNYQYASKDTGGFVHNGKYVIQLLHDSINDLNTQLASPIDLSAAGRDDPGHFFGAGEAARHWDEDGMVSADCSKCHAGVEGFDFFVEHGVGAEVELGNGLECSVCHDAETFDARTLTEVELPSGVVLEDEAGSADFVCATCHSGREAKASIDDAIASGSLSFKNVHYLPAAAVKMGADGEVGYEYDGMTYAGEWVHAANGGGCADCHDPAGTDHTFDVADGLSACSGCHAGITEPRDIRFPTNTTDWDGDGDATEALADEIGTVAEAVLAAMQDQVDVCYDSHSYPYWFSDTNGNGVCDGGEATYSNRFQGWTDATLKASFNYQFALKEPGAWAHNFDYMFQLLYDTVDDLGGDVGDYTRP